MEGIDDDEQRVDIRDVGDRDLQYLQKARAESAEPESEAREEEDNHEQNRRIGAYRLPRFI
jgi:hypothetical protein